MSRAVLIYDDVPKSLNKLGSRGSNFAYNREKKRWQQIFEACLMVERVPRGLASVTASAVLVFPVRRQRDEGNFRFFIEKALGDALTNGGWLADDTKDTYSFGAVDFSTDPGPKKTIVTIRYTKD